MNIKIKQIPDKSVNMIILDLPIKKSLCQHLLLVKEWLYECYRILKDDGQVYIFGSEEYIMEFWDLEIPFKKKMIVGIRGKKYKPIFLLTKNEINIKRNVIMGSKKEIINYLLFNKF